MGASPGSPPERPVTTWEPGRYYENNKVAKINPQVKDDALAQGLWERSEALLGL